MIARRLAGCQPTAVPKTIVYIKSDLHGDSAALHARAAQRRRNGSARVGARRSAPCSLLAALLLAALLGATQLHRARFAHASS
jgi:hypothetical protein